MMFPIGLGAKGLFLLGTFWLLTGLFRAQAHLKELHKSKHV